MNVIFVVIQFIGHYMNKRPRFHTSTASEPSALPTTARLTPVVAGTDSSSDAFVIAESRLLSHPDVQVGGESAGQSSATASPVANRENVVCLPPSPLSNRDRFRASQMPSQVTCDLSAISVEPGHRFTFQGIVLVVFPSASNPLRRHVLVGDGRGVVGLTVWNAHVNSFSSDSIGQLLVVSKVSVVIHNGTRGITLNKESTVQFNTLSDHFASVWWLSIPHSPAVSAILFADQKDNAVVNVAGIIGSVASEQKTVRSDARELVTIKLVDRTGVITLRTWNHHSDSFLPLVDSPVLFRRVRVTSFATQKAGELFDGSGTTIDRGDFPGSDDLRKFWSE